MVDYIQVDPLVVVLDPFVQGIRIAIRDMSAEERDGRTIRSVSIRIKEIFVGLAGIPAGVHRIRSVKGMPFIT